MAGITYFFLFMAILLAALSLTGWAGAASTIVIILAAISLVLFLVSFFIGKDNKKSA